MMKKFLRAYATFLKRIKYALKAYIKGISNAFNKIKRV
mgnify:FL=1|jgi:hypothetical protein